MRSGKLIAALLFVFSLHLHANEYTALIDSANAAYTTNNFEKAAELYQRILDKNVESSEIYFNLGNAYYKMNKTGFAILNYERAKKLDPDDDDINVNLKHAYQKTEDKIEAAPELFLTEWKNGIVNLMSEKEWSILFILFICITLLFFLFYIMSRNNGIRRFGFYTGAIFIVLSISTFFIAKHKYELTVNSSGAVITGESVTVNGSPNEKGTKLFILHEGTKVNITEDQSDWTEIRIANGNTGWIKTSQLQKI
jgi:tetratricopeptide (TPR) repeat protein